MASSVQVLIQRHVKGREPASEYYSVVPVLWDRVASSFRMRADSAELDCGLDDVDDAWQTFAGLLKTPFQSANRNAD